MYDVSNAVWSLDATQNWSKNLTPYWKLYILLGNLFILIYAYLSAFCVDAQLFSRHWNRIYILSTYCLWMVILPTSWAIRKWSNSKLGKSIRFVVVYHGEINLKSKWRKASYWNSNCWWSWKVFWTRFRISKCPAWNVL